MRLELARRMVPHMEIIRFDRFVRSKLWILILSLESVFLLPFHLPSFCFCFCLACSMFVHRWNNLLAIHSVNNIHSPYKHHNADSYSVPMWTRQNIIVRMSDLGSSILSLNLAFHDHLSFSLPIYPQLCISLRFQFFFHFSLR